MKQKLGKMSLKNIGRGQNTIKKYYRERKEALRLFQMMTANTHETFDILNSHGSQFADNGYFRMPYSYALNKDLAFEFYCVD